MWFDDGRGGTEQGHLSTGQETTTNTYEGHVFFVTELGHKDKVIARFTMVKEKVNAPNTLALSSTIVGALYVELKAISGFVYYQRS